ncbi:nitrate- and nitrite sensing domain-containing protein [Streptomyces sp. TLI_171]|uniref:nitrate- and nitrite sensing domain-containing protein n=1 Tax=Streptomyces sp. TLI_171 TaxID=1938859 RepID=UPI000C4A9750|nr:nitrate- and nitrite sensing domain-containing protein [Streptomyces sp. TLI_171]RKE22435.1 signal transduction histidine kinase [Streptomyces sp. TLI_171]
MLAIVPGVALAALWAVTSGQLLLDFQRQAAQGLLAQEAGQPSNIVYYNLQEERRLSADVLATHSGGSEALKAQRAKTDEAIRQFQKLSDVSADDAPAEVREAVQQARQAINQLPAQRALVDGGGEQQQATVYRYYTDLIAVDLKLFAALSHVDNGKMTTISQPLVDLFWGKEMISRSDALLARGWPSGSLSSEDYQQLRQAIAEQDFQFGTKALPYLAADETAMWQKIAASPAWQAKLRVEQDLLKPTAADRSGRVALGVDQSSWRQSVDALTPDLVGLLEHRTGYVVEQGKSSIIALALRLVLTTVVGLVAVVAVAITSWRLTRTLRRRISRLQQQAEDLENTLPEVVERLGNGEQVDLEEHARAIERDPWARTEDELAKLAEAFNLARTSAVQAAVAQAEQHRAYERLLQRIARRTQLLIGQQLKKLDELERRHEDPEFLEGLFDLDHLTARLRRYEENLVILAGGTPHRRWRKPVPLLDVMRAAQGEVQDYRRVVIDLDGSPWISERAVGPVAHVLAELIENALTFSRPPNPVEVRAGRVSRGVAIEVEDRGLGMDEEQIDEANELMTRPPRADVLARGDDIRLGFYVIARLAEQHGLRIEFRQSAFGGTRVVVLVPDELIVPDPTARPTVVPAQSTGGLPTRSRGQALAGVAALSGLPDPVAEHLALPPVTAEVPYVPIEDPYAPVAHPQHELIGGHPQEYLAAGHEQPFPDAVQPLEAAPAPYALPAPYLPEPVAVEPWPAEPAPAEPFHGGGYPQAAPALPAGEPPLPRRIRQASLVDELRIDPAAPAPAPAPPRWDENPLFRPAPRRAGAAIGAFQRRSREARSGPVPPAADSTAPGERPEPADTWNTHPIPTREDRS